MRIQLTVFLFDFLLILAMSVSLAVAALLVGMRIGTERLAAPVLANVHVLSQLTDDNLAHMRLRYLEQQHAWQRATLLAGLLACLSGAGYLAYQHFSVSANSLISFLLALLMVMFLTTIGSAGYHWGARLGMLRTFRRASDSLMVALHKRMLKQELPAHIPQMAKQLPKKKCFIHLMVVHYAIHEALQGMKRENA